jgi:hypothetical protein
MRRRTRIITSLLLAVALAFAAAPAAHAASAFEQVLSDYQKDGKIDPCAHSENTLRDAASQIPNDIEQYAPDFPTALQDAIDARTQGKCAGKDTGGGSGSGGSGGSSGGGSSGGGSSGGGVVPPATTSPPSTSTPSTPGATPPGAATPQTGTTPAPPTVPKPATANGKRTSANSGSSSSDPPVPFLLIAIVAGLVLLTAAFFGTTRWLGWDFHHAAGMRQSWGEAGYRAGGTWADFRDWLRNGR